MGWMGRRGDVALWSRYNTVLLLHCGPNMDVDYAWAFASRLRCEFPICSRLLHPTHLLKTNSFYLFPLPYNCAPAAGPAGTQTSRAHCTPSLRHVDATAADDSAAPLRVSWRVIVSAAW